MAASTESGHDLGDVPRIAIFGKRQPRSRPRDRAWAVGSHSSVRAIARPILTGVRQALAGERGTNATNDPTRRKDQEGTDHERRHRSVVGREGAQRNHFVTSTILRQHPGREARSRSVSIHGNASTRIRQTAAIRGANEQRLLLDAGQRLEDADRQARRSGSPRTAGSDSHSGGPRGGRGRFP